MFPPVRNRLCYIPLTLEIKLLSLNSQLIVLVGNTILIMSQYALCPHAQLRSQAYVGMQMPLVLQVKLPQLTSGISHRCGRKLCATSDSCHADSIPHDALAVSLSSSPPRTQDFLPSLTSPFTMR